jgi:hypothetical protein
MSHHRSRLAVAALLVAALPAATTTAAQASDDDKIRRGSCSGSTDWKIKAKADDGRIEVEGEIDSNHRGQSWKWVLKHDGSVSARGSATTKGPSGSFSVERKTVNAKGVDHFTFRAKRPASGEVCVAKISW